MELVPFTVTLAATLLPGNYVAAEDPNAKLLQQNILQVYSDMKKQAFGRELLDLDSECFTNQQQLIQNPNLTRWEMNDDVIFGEGDDDQWVPNFCDRKIIDSGDIIATCDFDNVGSLYDSDACSSVGGRIIKLNYFEDQTECDLISIKTINQPECLHVTCDVDEWAAFLENSVNNGNGNGDCDIVWYVSVSSGGAIFPSIVVNAGGALVSLITMLW